MVHEVRAADSSMRRAGLDSGQWVRSAAVVRGSSEVLPVVLPLPRLIDAKT